MQVNVRDSAAPLPVVRPLRILYRIALLAITALFAGSAVALDMPRPRSVPGGVAIIVCLQPILIALTAPRFVGERVGRMGWLGLLLGLAGAALVIGARSSIAAESPAGIALTVVALFGITLGTLWEKRFGVRHHPVTVNLIQYSVLPSTQVSSTRVRSSSWASMPFMGGLPLCRETRAPAGRAACRRR